MPRNLIKAAVAAALLSVVVLGVLVWLHPSTPWRIEVLRRKLAGELPNLTWTEVVAGLRSGVPNLDGLVLGAVTLHSVRSEQPCPALWSTPHGLMGGRFEDENVLEHFVTGSWYGSEPNFPASEAPKVETGDVVLEVGAWIGCFTHYALNRGARLVVAIEPEPVNLACLKQNFDQEIREGRVVIIEAAAWSAPGPLTIANEGPDNPYASGKGFAVSEDGILQVEALTIDALIDQLSLEQLDFINMDVEGGEREVIEGARETINRFRPRIAMCIHHLPGDRESLPPLVLAIRPDYRVATTPYQGFFF